jgi:hypothetical protein
MGLYDGLTDIVREPVDGFKKHVSYPTLLPTYVFTHYVWYRESLGERGVLSLAVSD